MSKDPSDVEAFEEQWKKKGWHVKLLDFSPDIILVELDGSFSAQQLEKIAGFLREAADGSVPEYSRENYG